MKKLIMKLAGLIMFVIGLLLFFPFLKNIVKGIDVIISSNHSYSGNNDGGMWLATTGMAFAIFLLMKVGNKLFHIH